MPLYELLGRYAEDPAVVVEAATAPEAADKAIALALPVSRGYGPGGQLIPTELPPEAAARYRREQAW